MTDSMVCCIEPSGGFQAFPGVYEKLKALRSDSSQALSSETPLSVRQISRLFMHPSTDRVYSHLCANVRGYERRWQAQVPGLESLNGRIKSRAVDLYTRELSKEAFTKLIHPEASSPRPAKRRRLAPSGAGTEHTSAKYEIPINTSDLLVDSGYFYMATTKGRRTYQEDCCIYGEEIMVLEGSDEMMTFGFVFDGHGGQQASSFLRTNFSLKIKTMLAELCRESFSEAKVLQGIRQSIFDLQKAFVLSMRASVHNRISVGSTITGFLWLKNKIYGINLGDSRTLMIRSDDKHVIPLSSDHKADDESRVAAVYAEGGCVTKGICPRISGRNAVGRAFGYYQYFGMSCEPEIMYYSLVRGDERAPVDLIIASDGLFEQASSKQVVEELTNLESKSIAPVRDLVNKMIIAESRDNITLLHFKEKRPSVATLSGEGSDGV